jgi:hypothetical protein
LILRLVDNAQKAKDRAGMFVVMASPQFWASTSW